MGASAGLFQIRMHINGQGPWSPTMTGLGGGVARSRGQGSEPIQKSGAWRGARAGGRFIGAGDGEVFLFYSKDCWTVATCEADIDAAVRHSEMRPLALFWMVAHKPS